MKEHLIDLDHGYYDPVGLVPELYALASEEQKPLIITELLRLAASEQVQSSEHMKRFIIKKDEDSVGAFWSKGFYPEKLFLEESIPPELTPEMILCMAAAHQKWEDSQ